MTDGLCTDRDPKIYNSLFLKSAGLWFFLSRMISTIRSIALRPGSKAAIRKTPFSELLSRPHALGSLHWFGTSDESRLSELIERVKSINLQLDTYENEQVSMKRILSKSFNEWDPSERRAYSSLRRLQKQIDYLNFKERSLIEEKMQLLDEKNAFISDHFLILMANHIYLYWEEMML